RRSRAPRFRWPGSPTACASSTSPSRTRHARSRISCRRSPRARRACAATTYMWTIVGLFTWWTACAGSTSSSACDGRQPADPGPFRDSGSSGVRLVCGNRSRCAVGAVSERDDDELEGIVKIDAVGMADCGFHDGQLSIHPWMEWGDGFPLSAWENHGQMCGGRLDDCGCYWLEDILRD